ncbi:MAG: type II toxin-antitoxin system RelE/ParE family toxin [Bacteroidaceae bacterium]|nr:type II toxin-antitoxin system RelE/ParE family toxin [Bacteroidaceae bacterium]
MANYYLTNKAVEDLTDIWNYTFEVWSERQADDYYNMLIASCRKIAANPKLFGKCYNEILEGLKGFKANKHILFYRILDSGDVEIIRILHERMDLRNRLNE